MLSGFFPAFIALFIALIPALTQMVQVGETLDALAVATGIATLFAILYRIALKIPFNHTSTNWRRNLSLVHTAFAIGCIPGVLIFFAAPELLGPLEQKAGGHLTTGEQVPYYAAARFVLIISVWAAVTEEFLYRGLLLAVLRRTRIFALQYQRDVFAIIISSLAFGLAHFLTWGPGPAIAITGLGIGLGIGYIASGERLSLLILYHTLFDVLSLSATFLSGLLRS